MAARRKTKNITASQLHLQGEFGTLVSVHDVYHENVDRIFPENTVNDSQIGCSSNGGQQEDKSIQNSVTKVSFCTIIIRLSQCTTVITTVHCAAQFFNTRSVITCCYMDR